MISKLCKPFSTQDPNVSTDELSQLDALADKVEILRLKGLGVLLPTSTLPPGGVKKLTTRFVWTWRDKFIGDTILASKVKVAREFSWPSPHRQDLFSPVQSPTGCFRIAIFTDFLLTAAKCWQLLTLEIPYS